MNMTHPEEFHYDIFEDYDEDEGIFRKKDDPFGSYGDEDAIEDLNEDMAVSPIQFILGPDGLPMPSPHVDAMAIMNERVKVSERELVCLAGPCDHYVELAVQAEEGLSLTARFCTLIRSWAEPMRLDEVDVVACSGHVSAEETWRTQANEQMIAEQNQKAGKLGICYDGSCKHYFLQMLRVLDDGGELVKKNVRYCNKLSGAARPMNLYSFSPVITCSAIEPDVNCGITRDAIIRGKLNLEKSRRKFAKVEDQSESRDSGCCKAGCGQSGGEECPGHSSESDGSSVSFGGEHLEQGDQEAPEGCALPDFGSDLE